MICLKDVSKIYNQGKANETQALQHVTLTIKKGDMVAITGPSGSGKSTLLHIIAGIDAQTSGVYEYDGNDVRKMSDRGKCELRNKKIGIILQDFGLAMIRCFEISVCRKSSLELIRKALIKKYGYCCSRLVWKDWNTKR